jgi:hypothetical protein
LHAGDPERGNPSEQESLMRIGIIGGLERAEQHFERVAEEAGFDVVFHDGFVGGHGRAVLGKLLDRCDVVILVTDVNSHGAVQFARHRLRHRGLSPIIVRRFGLARFGELVETIARDGVDRAMTGTR